MPRLKRVISPSEAQASKFARGTGAAEAIFQMYLKGDLSQTIFDKQVKDWLKTYGEAGFR